MGRRKKAAKRGGGLSLTELQAMVREQEKAVTALKARRAKLEAELESADAELAAALGGGGGRRAPQARATAASTGAAVARRGPRGKGQSLEDYIRRVLSGASAPMKLSAIKDAVLAAGYATKSKTFGVIVGQRLAGMDDVSKAGHGLYQIGGGRASAPKARKNVGRKTKRKARRKKRAGKKGAGRRAKATASGSK